MRWGALVVGCMILLAMRSVCAQETIGPLQLPTQFCAGITTDGTHLWCVDRKAREIVCVDPKTGEALKSIAVDDVHSAGLEWWNGRLYLVKGRDRVMCRIDPADGTVELTVPLNGRSPTGIVIREGKAWVADWLSPTIEIRDLTEDGKLVETIPSPHSPLWGGTYLDGVLWFVAPDHRLAYGIDAETGAVVGALPTPMDKPTYVVALDGELALGSWQANTLSRVPIDMEVARANLPERPQIGTTGIPARTDRRRTVALIAVALLLAGAAATAVLFAWRRRRGAADEDYATRPEVLYTFLAVDVRGSTEMKAGREPVSVRRTFDDYHAWVRRHVEAHRGEVYSRSGDGVLCRFARASDALAAARSLRDHLAAFNASHNLLGSPLRVGMGLHTGPLLEAPGDDRGQVSSATLDFAMKLQAQAAPEEILLSEDTLSRLPSREGIVEAGMLFSQKPVYRLS